MLVYVLHLSIIPDKKKVINLNTVAHPVIISLQDLTHGPNIK